MVLGIKHRIAYLADLARLRVSPNAIPIWYYQQTPNVGDALSMVLLPGVAGRPVVRVNSQKIRHIRAIGSILDHAPKNSITWGSGLIAPDPPSNSLDPCNIRAVRGHLTRQVVEQHVGTKKTPVGDPAILTSKYFVSRSYKKYELGIVPHYIDFPKFISLSKDIPLDVCIIDVRKHPRKFISELSSCRNIISSSLHGLILSDSYGIPNAWVKFSDKIKGGTFKFEDYYSTTDTPRKWYTEVTDIDKLPAIMSSMSRDCSVSNFIEPVASLLSAFPGRQELAQIPTV